MQHHELPNGQFKITDDTIAKAILLELGMLGKIPDPVAFSQLLFVVAVHWHPTHRLLLLRYNGYDNTADNGYVIMGWPKKYFSEEKAHMEMVRWLTQHADNPNITLEIINNPNAN